MVGIRTMVRHVTIVDEDDLVVEVQNVVDTLRGHGIDVFLYARAGQTFPSMMA